MNRGPAEPKARAVWSAGARSQGGEELVGGGDRRGDLLVGGAPLQGAHEAVEAGAVGLAPQEVPVEALDGALEALLAGEDGRGDLVPGGPVRQGRAKPRLADRVDAAVEDVLVEGAQEAVVGAAAAD